MKPTIALLALFVVACGNLLGGYPASRQTARTVQVYDITTNTWTLGPPLPQPNNHGMAAGVNGKVYLIGGQTTDLSEGPYVDTVYELDPAMGEWVEKSTLERMAELVDTWPPNPR